MTGAANDAYDELCAYTLSHGGGTFIHQHVVDAHAAQEGTGPPIRLAFALIGLYLHIERGWSGGEVQALHKVLADRTHSWPAFDPPQHRGAMTAVDVVAAPEGEERNQAIEAWSRCVWAAYAASKPGVEALLRRHGVV